jgi:hypothetical protein
MERKRILLPTATFVNRKKPDEEEYVPRFVFRIVIRTPEIGFCVSLSNTFPIMFAVCEKPCSATQKVKANSTKNKKRCQNIFNRFV